MSRLGMWDHSIVSHCSPCIICFTVGRFQSSAVPKSKNQPLQTSGAGVTCSSKIVDMENARYHRWSTKGRFKTVLLFGNELWPILGHAIAIPKSKAPRFQPKVKTWGIPLQRPVYTTELFGALGIPRGSNVVPFWAVYYNP